MQNSSNHLKQNLNEKAWFFSFGENKEHGKIRLICFPYAGGSASFFHSWNDMLPKEIEIMAIELPGRSSRIKEPLLTDFTELLDKLESLDELYKGKPFAFFGHSMGASIAFELSRRLEKKNKPLPVHLFISGREPPNKTGKKKTIHNLPEEEFIEEIVNLNGMPEEILDNTELMDLISPVLRADCQLLETWSYIEDEKLSIPITVLVGDKDPSVNLANANKWAELSNNKFEILQFPGDHFFINNEKQVVLDAITDRLI